jgi:hypothetical protein
MQRTQSDTGSSLGGPSTKRWRKALNRIGSKGSVREPKSWTVCLALRYPDLFFYDRLPERNVTALLICL